MVIGFVPVVMEIWVILSVVKDSEAAGQAASVFRSPAVLMSDQHLPMRQS